MVVGGCVAAGEDCDFRDIREFLEDALDRLLAGVAAGAVDEDAAGIGPGDGGEDEGEEQGGAHGGRLRGRVGFQGA